MEQTTAEQEKKATLRSWMIIIAMVFVFLLWGLFIFFVVGDKGPPPWNFGVVEDVPGQSPYSTERR
jgi:flagellar basal body-associated protein FliL